MSALKRIAVAAFAGLTLTAGLALPVRAEPLTTLVAFDRGAYDDSSSSEIVVRITRVDQDPATADEEVSVDCTLNGGTAVENLDYRLVFNDGVQGLGTITFPPGVREQSFTIHTTKGAGPDKTLLIGLSNPTGAAPVVTGANAVARITINAPAR